MKTTIDIKGIRKKFERMFDRDPGKVHITPRRDWMALLFLFACINILGAGFGYIFFMDISEGTTVSTGEEKVARILDSEELRRVLEAEREKEKVFEILKANPPQEF